MLTCDMYRFKPWSNVYIYIYLKFGVYHILKIMGFTLRIHMFMLGLGPKKLQNRAILLVESIMLDPRVRGEKNRVVLWHHFPIEPWQFSLEKIFFPV